MHPHRNWTSIYEIYEKGKPYFGDKKISIDFPVNINKKSTRMIYKK